MAHATGTANDHIDFWDKLLAFLKTDPTLVAAGQNWTQVFADPADSSWPNSYVLKGPGLAGQDAVYVGLRRTDNAMTPGESAIFMTGASALSATAQSIYGHVNDLGYHPWMFLDQAPMTYWFVANGRRFIAVAKIANTVYQAMYGGFFLPYAKPDVYGIPLFIGGTAPRQGSSVQYVQSWRSTDSRHRNFPFGQGYYGSSGEYRQVASSANFLAPDGAWVTPSTNLYDAGGYLGLRTGGIHWQGMASMGLDSGSMSYSSMFIGREDVFHRLEAGFNGEMPLTPILLSMRDNDTTEVTTCGILDGVYSVPGEGQVTENVITADGVDHVVFPDVYRTDVNHYWALALD